MKYSFITKHSEESLPTPSGLKPSQQNSRRHRSHSQTRTIWVGVVVSLKKQVGSVVVVGTVAMKEKVVGSVVVVGTVAMEEKVVGSVVVEEKVVGSVAVAKDSPTHSAVH